MPPAVTTTEELELTDVGGPGGGAPGGFGDSGGGDGEAAIPRTIYFTGLTIGLAGILMFFMALTSAYVVRKGLSGDWRPIELPRILWLNTAILIASSLTVEKARRWLARRSPLGFQRWWGITTALGLLFLAGQLIAWRQLAAAGVFLATNPSSSFFYLLTAAHGVHLVGGELALLYVALRNWQAARVTRSTAAELTSIYWHFMDGLWVFLFLLLHWGR